MLLEEFFATLHSVLGKDDRFSLSYWIQDHSLLMQAVHCVPIVALPRRRAKSHVAPREVKQSKHRFVNLVRNGARPVQPSNHHVNPTAFLIASSNA